VVVCAVTYEPVSDAKFPVIREINGNLPNSGPLPQAKSENSNVISGVYAEFAISANRVIFTPKPGF
jgi:hypothetical protein